MVIDELLGPLGRVIFYSVISVAVIVILLIIACFITPGCLGYECVRPKKKLEKPPASEYNSKQNDSVKLSDVSYRSWRVGSLYDTDSGTIQENQSTSPRNSLDSNNSHFEPVNTTSVSNLVESSKWKNGASKEFPTECTLSLRYFPHCEGITSSKLVIGIEALSSLPPKQYNCVLEPYVILEVLKNSWTQRNRQKLYSFKTKAVKQTANPSFKESFVISGVSQQDTKDWILSIEAHDHDRYANHTKLCELQVPLKDAKRVFLSPELHLFNFQMKPSKVEYGNILLGVSYLPTAQRLSINVMKLKNLKCAHAVRTAGEFNPYVRVLMLNGKTGRRLKKKKTRSIPRTMEPEFNETLTFDLPATQMDTLQFLVILCSKANYEENHSSMMNEVQSDGESSINSYQKPKDICVGKVALGKGVRGVTERLHWFSVLQNPRKLVTVWHTLK